MRTPNHWYWETSSTRSSRHDLWGKRSYSGRMVGHDEDSLKQFKPYAANQCRPIISLMEDLQEWA